MASFPLNPDRRELPAGWIQQYNPEYRRWFYVNTREQPPRSCWEHPLDGAFSPPAAPPPDNSYNRSPYPGGPSTSQPAPYGGGYGQGYQPSYDPRNNAPQGAWGGPAPGYQQGAYPPRENRGWFGSSGGQHSQQPRRSGPGIGTALLAGGAGLAGGALLMDAIEDHDEHEREEGFEQGYDQGYDQGFDQGFDGGDFGGGDW